MLHKDTSNACQVRPVTDYCQTNYARVQYYCVDDFGSNVRRLLMSEADRKNGQL